MIWIGVIILLILTYIFFKSRLHILSKGDAEHVLQQNADSYYETFTEMDLRMRGVSSVDEYRRLIINCCVEPTVRDQFRIVWGVMCACVSLCRVRIQNDWFDSIKCAFIPWKIAIVDDTHRYENGLSHTRGEVIFITRETLYDYGITNTMIHEKIHVYQKKYPASIQHYIRKFHFTSDMNRRENAYLNREYVRANPDTNDLIYADENNVLLKAVYEPNAKTIGQVRYTSCNSQYCEHPHERMVHDILELIIK